MRLKPIFDFRFTEGETLADFQFWVYKGRNARRFSILVYKGRNFRQFLTVVLQRAKLSSIFKFGFTKGETLANFQFRFSKGRNFRRFSTFGISHAGFTKGETVADFQFWFTGWNSRQFSILVLQRATLSPIFNFGFTKGETLADFQLKQFKQQNTLNFEKHEKDRQVETWFFKIETHQFYLHGSSTLAGKWVLMQVKRCFSWK